MDEFLKEMLTRIEEQQRMQGEQLRMQGVQLRVLTEQQLKQGEQLRMQGEQLRALAEQQLKQGEAMRVLAEQQRMQGEQLAQLLGAISRTNNEAAEADAKLNARLDVLEKKVDAIADGVKKDLASVEYIAYKTASDVALLKLAK